MAKMTNGKGRATAPKKDDILSFINKDDTVEGFEQLTRETMAIPFIRILQPLSPQLNNKKPEYNPDAKLGEYYNTVTKEALGEEIRLIVLKFERIYIEWLPNRGGFVGYHDIENAERIAVDKTFGKWVTEDGNVLQENYVYLCLISGQEQKGLCVLSLASSMIKQAREWNRLLTTQIMDDGERAKPYYMIWNLTTVYNENEKGEWYSPKIVLEEYINKGQYDLVMPERKMLPDRTIDYALLDTSKDEEKEEY